MRKTSKRLSALLLALVMSLSLSLPALAAEPASSPSSAATDPVNALETAARAAATTAKTYGSATSISWAVWQDGHILTNGTEASPQDPNAGHLAQLGAMGGRTYGIGSVSKIYTTVAVLQLAEQGKLDLDRPVTTYLPAFRMADERYRQITVRMLLNHSSGLMGSSMGSGVLYGDPSTVAADTLLQRLSTQRLKADPGAYSVYCNDGFTLAELVVEAVSGQDFMAYVRANILTPAGLKETYAPGDDFHNQVPIYYGEESRPLPMDCLGTVGTGGIYATAEDLASFGGALTGTTLLKESSLEAMAAPEYRRGLWPDTDAPDALSYGLGWDSVVWFPFSQNDITALVKGGDTQHYHAGLVVLPAYHMAAAVVSSGGVSTYNELAAGQMLIAALKLRGVTVDETAPALPAAQPAAMPQDLLSCAGYYGSLVPYQIEITKEGQLSLTALGMGAPAQVFTYYDDGSFRDETGAAALLRFVEEDNGNTYLYQQAFTPLPGLGGLGTAGYAAVRLPENEIAPEMQAQWDQALGDTDVLPMNERYSSQVYLALSALSAQEEDGEAAAEGIPGYVGALRIEDEAHARYVVQIPGNVGRDGYDLELRRDREGTLWIYQSNGAVYMDSSAAPALAPRNGKASVTIPSSGYAQWYTAGTAAGKLMTVRLPKDSGFWAYDKDWNVIASSVLWGDTTVRLPEGGWVVFAGNPDARFQLSFR